MFLGKQIIVSKYEKFNGILQQFLIVVTHVDNLPWFYLIEAAVQRGVLKKRCSETMQQIYRRTIMQKCDFDNFAASSQNTLSLEHLWTAVSDLN